MRKLVLPIVLLSVLGFEISAAKLRLKVKGNDCVYKFIMIECKGDSEYYPCQPGGVDSCDPCKCIPPVPATCSVADPCKMSGKKASYCVSTSWTEYDLDPDVRRISFVGYKAKTSDPCCSSCGTCEPCDPCDTCDTCCVSPEDKEVVVCPQAICVPDGACNIDLIVKFNKKGSIILESKTRGKVDMHTVSSKERHEIGPMVNPSSK